MRTTAFISNPPSPLPQRHVARAWDLPLALPPGSPADAALRWAATLWLVLCVVVQGALAGAAVMAWWRGSPAADGIAAAVQHAGQLALGGASGGALDVTVATLVLAALGLLSGALRLLPARAGASNEWQRWNARFQVGAGLAVGAGALWLASRPVGMAGDASAWDAGAAMNATATGVFAVLTWRHGLSARRDVYRGWALRLWVMVSFVVWHHLARAMGAGMPATAASASAWAWALLQCLLPLLALEYCLHARDCGTRRSKRLAAAGLGALCVATVTCVAAVGAGVGWMA